MAIMAADSVFLDTNVLVHATIAQAPLFQKAQVTIATLKQSRAEIWISSQVLREYLAVLSRPQALLVLDKPVSASTLVAEVRAFQTCIECRRYQTSGR